MSLCTYNSPMNKVLCFVTLQSEVLFCNINKLIIKNTTRQTNQTSCTNDLQSCEKPSDTRVAGLFKVTMLGRSICPAVFGSVTRNHCGLHF